MSVVIHSYSYGQSNKLPISYNRVLKIKIKRQTNYRLIANESIRELKLLPQQDSDFAHANLVHTVYRSTEGHSQNVPLYAKFIIISQSFSWSQLDSGPLSQLNSLLLLLSFPIHSFTTAAPVCPSGWQKAPKQKFVGSLILPGGIQTRHSVARSL